MMERIQELLEQIVKWLIFSILLVASISLMVVYQQGYIAEALVARATPLAIVVGLSAIAAAIIVKK
jgi:uncharacterized membrane protein (DUF485 family)